MLQPIDPLSAAERGFSQPHDRLCLPLAEAERWELLATCVFSSEERKASGMRCWCLRKLDSRAC